MSSAWSVSPSPSFTRSIPPWACSWHRLATSGCSLPNSPGRHTGQELNWDIHSSALAWHLPTLLQKGCSHVPLGQGPTSPRAVGAARGHPSTGDGAQGGVGLAPPVFPSLVCLLHALCCTCFYPGFGQGMRARARKTRRCILSWAVGQPGGSEVACLFKVLLICCLFVFL